MVWNANLSLAYQMQGSNCALRFRHDGPLRVLKSLYPEGPGICHSVLVHPPGGLVGGDVLNISVDVASGAHALISTPGATRFYKSDGPLAEQHTSLHIGPGAKLEWLPLEAIAYPGCNALNSLNFSLDSGAQFIAWDITALGLPSADLAFDAPNLPRESAFRQQLHWPGKWQERASILGNDHRLLNAALGLAGMRCMGTLLLAQADAPTRAQAEALTDALRESWQTSPDAKLCGCTWVNPNLLVVRTLGALTEPVTQRLKACWALLRAQAWAMADTPPRIWSV